MFRHSATNRATHDVELRTAAELVGNATDVTLVAHVQPDADALGSALALGLALHRRGSMVRVTVGESAATPESLRGLDVAGLLVPPEHVPAQPELLGRWTRRTEIGWVAWQTGWTPPVLCW